MMRRFRAFFLQAYHSVWGRVLLSAALTAAMLALFSLVQQVSYLTNDDNAIAFTLAGYHTGAPSPYALFINCILGYAVSGLYTILPGVAWWAVLQMAAIGLSCVAIGAVLLKEGAKREAPMLAPLLLHAALLLLLVLRPFCEPTYTVTAALLGAAGSALILAAADEARAITRGWLDALGLLMVVSTFLFREETGFAVLCFFMAACLYRILVSLRGDLAMRRRAVYSASALLVAAAVLCGGAFMYNKAMRVRVNGAEYETFFRYRERFTDYPRPAYNEAEALYASVGWDETLYDLADHWCFLDERINADTLRAITSAAPAHIPFWDAAKACVDLVDGDVPSRLIVASSLILFAMGLFSWQRSMRRWPSFAILCALLLGACLLCLYLGLRGRFLLRTFQVVMVPAVALSGVLIMRMYAPRADRPGRIWCMAFLSLMLVTASASAWLMARTLRVNSPKQLISDSRAVYAYVLEHPENAYIRDTFVINDVDAFTVYPEEKPTNLLSWGGCELRSAESERQRFVNGLHARNADVFREPGVYFLTRADSSEYAVLHDYLVRWRGASGMALVDWVTDEIAVYEVRY